MQKYNTAALLVAVGKLAAGTVSGYALLVVLTPVLTRIYTPADLGAFSLIAASVGVLAPILGLGYPFGQLSARTRTGSARFAATALGTAAAFSALLLVVGLLVAFVASARSAFVWAMLCALVCSSVAVITSVAVNWAIAQGREARAATATFVNLGGRAVFQTGFGVAIGGVKGLILGELCGRLAAWAIAESGMCRVAFRRCLSKFDAVCRHARRERYYPTLVTPSMTAENFLVWLPAPIFAFTFGAEVGGLVALVQRFVSVPLTIANQSIAALFHREFVGRSEEQTATIRKMLIGMAAVVGATSMPLSAVIERRGSELASVVFGGEQWSGVATVTAAFIPICAAQFICLFTDRILLIIGRNDLKLIFLMFALLIGGMVIIVSSSLGWTWQTAMWAYAGSQTLVYLLLFFTVIRASESYSGSGVHKEI
jgi:O-antigen/teichoic acid export membrane protein